MAGRDANSAEQNAECFAPAKHGRDVTELDTDRNVWEAVTGELGGPEFLLDVGDGSVFDHDTKQVDEIVATDLFLDQLPPSRFPPNVTPRRGDALDRDEADGSYDVGLEALLCHLAGPLVAAAAILALLSRRNRAASG
jgi:hypothetical protein